MALHALLAGRRAKALEKNREITAAARRGPSAEDEAQAARYARMQEAKEIVKTGKKTYARNKQERAALLVDLCLQVMEGKLTGIEAAETAGCSERQVWYAIKKLRNSNENAKK